MHQQLYMMTTQQSRVKESPKEHFQDDRHSVVLAKLAPCETERVGWKDGVLSLQLSQILHERKEEESTATTESTDRFCV